MSQENIEVVRRCFEAWDRGDVDAVVREYSADVEVDMSRVIDGTFHGREAVRDYYVSVFDNLRFTNDDLELIDAGDDVVALTRARGTGTGTGAEGEVSFAYVFTVRDGLVRRIRMFVDHREALEAAGLSG
jgi:ketosteroid isomerase-like protein